MIKRSLQQIKNKIKNGEATILTAEEVTSMVNEGIKPTLDEVDVITTGTCGVMSGTAVIFHLPVSEPGSFQKAAKVTLNGVPGYPGPCPNEWLGSVDLIVYGTSKSSEDPTYGGGFLFKDMTRGEEINVEVESLDGELFSSVINLDDVGTARMIGTRFAFKNYNAFVNPSSEPVTSIFHAIDMKGPLTEISFSGCGQLNPVQNDPHLNTLKRGVKVLLNGAEGIILGTGTRSSPLKPNLMISADLDEMDAHYLGGFKTGMGPEVYNTIAAAIPITSEQILKDTYISNKEIELPIADIRGRHAVLGKTNYSVWDGTDERPQYKEDDCRRCTCCLVEDRCPTGAFKDNQLNEKKCFGCGMCSYACPYLIFKMKTGQVAMDMGGNPYNLQVTCRQSDIKRARKLAEELKEKIVSKDFIL